MTPLRRLPFVRPSAGALGALSFGSGAYLLFATGNDAGGLFLLTLGTVLALIAVFGDRIELESFELLGARVKVREIVRRRLELAEQRSGSGAPEDQALIRALDRAVSRRRFRRDEPLMALRASILEAIDR